MPDRRGGRPSQVRPRPPSTGRPDPNRIRQRAPVTRRVSARPRVERRHGLPFLTRLLLVVAVGALGITAFMTVTGGLGRVVAALGTTVDGVLDRLTATPTPRPTLVVVPDSPVIVAPGQPDTNQATVDLVLTLPADAAGRRDIVARIYLALGEQAPAPILEVPVGATRTLFVPDVELTAGRNDFTATLRGPGGESEPSPVVTYVLDQDPPPIEIRSPRNGQTINRSTVTILGRTQPRSLLVARNEANAASATGQAGSDGSFELTLALGTGTNGITITATDPAGNASSTVLSLRRGSGQLTAALSADPFRLSRARLPLPLELTVAVTDPDGRPLTGAQVTFTLSIPGIPVVTSEAETGGDGRAVFRTSVPAGATEGQGLATVLVRTSEFGETTDRTVVTIVK